MAEGTTLGYALLGILARKPSSGYDLGRELKKPIGFYWQARYSQIYPELGKLQVQGLVTFEQVEQQDLPDKKVYTITPAGRAALEKWVTTPLDEPVQRDELVLRSYSLWLAQPRAALELFQQHERFHLEQLKYFQSLEKTIKEQITEEDWGNLASPDFCQYITLQRGIGYEREYTQWCHWVAEQLERGLKE